MINNIFVHDAVPTWSGFVYQGQIAVYLAVKKICELDAADKKEEMNCYAIEMEKCEDIAVVYEKDLAENKVLDVKYLGQIEQNVEVDGKEEKVLKDIYLLIEQQKDKDGNLIQIEKYYNM